MGGLYLLSVAVAFVGYTFPKYGAELRDENARSAPTVAVLAAAGWPLLLAASALRALAGRAR